MAYLLPSEYVQFGLSSETADAWISAASAMVDAYCRRTSILAASYTERLRLSRRGTAQLSYGPVTQVNTLRARYSACQRSPEFSYCGYSPEPGFAGASLCELGAVLGLPGQWVTLDASGVVLDAASGEVSLPCNAWQMTYSEVEVNYTAGLAAAPDGLKFAVAQIVKNAQATPGLNVRANKVDTLQTQYFSDSLLDQQVKAMLRPFVAERLG